MNHPPSESSGLRPLLRSLPLALLALAGGCATVGPQDQRLVSKPNMQFSRTAAYSYAWKLESNLLTGLQSPAGATATTCASCK
jgi:hypothetical protein